MGKIRRVGRPSMNNSTELVRMNSKLKKELEISFPEVPMPHLINVMYKTSGLRIENVLRRDLIVKKKK